jgi:uncharacterized protein HemY
VFYRRAISIREKALGTEHPEVAKTWEKLGQLYCAQKQYGKAEQFFLKVLLSGRRNSGLSIRT